MRKIFINLAMAAVFLTGMIDSAPAKDKISKIFTVPANQTRWHELYFAEGSLVDIEIAGNGASNLDLYIYDGNGRYITGSEDDSDFELAEIEILLRGGYFSIAVVNRNGAANDYRLTVAEY